MKMKRNLLQMFAMATFTVFALTSCKNENKTAEETLTDQSITPEQEKESSARLALDWSGTYKGVVPCADCPGIDETIELNSDGTFKIVMHYQERKDGHYEQVGTFNWDSTGSKMTLNPVEGDKTEIAIHENSILLLDQNGNVIEGPLADQYRLIKQ